MGEGTKTNRFRFWRWLIRVHSRMQIALMETLEQSQDHNHR